MLYQKILESNCISYPWFGSEVFKVKKLWYGKTIFSRGWHFLNKFCEKKGLLCKKEKDTWCSTSISQTTLSPSKEYKWPLVVPTSARLPIPAHPMRNLICPSHLCVSSPRRSVERSVSEKKQKHSQCCFWKIGGLKLKNLQKFAKFGNIFWWQKWVENTISQRRLCLPSSQIFPHYATNWKYVRSNLAERVFTRF